VAIEARGPLSVQVAASVEESTRHSRMTKFCVPDGASSRPA
jgi:hypothetical protein